MFLHNSSNNLELKLSKQTWPKHGFGIYSPFLLLPFLFPSSAHFFPFFPFSLLAKNNKRQIKSQGYSNMILRKPIWANYSEDWHGDSERDDRIGWTFSNGFSLRYNLSLNFQCGCQNALELLSLLKRFWFCELT